MQNEKIYRKLEIVINELENVIAEAGTIRYNKYNNKYKEKLKQELIKKVDNENLSNSIIELWEIQEILEVLDE